MDQNLFKSMPSDADSLTKFFDVQGDRKSIFQSSFLPPPLSETLSAGLL